MKSQRLEILLKSQEYSLLKEEADRRETSMGQVVRELVRDYIVEPRKEEKIRALRELIDLDLGLDLGTPEELCRELSDLHFPKSRQINSRK
jgi:hypothetical protein